jgi:hypothetical protein
MDRAQNKGSAKIGRREKARLENNRQNRAQVTGKIDRQEDRARNTGWCITGRIGHK